MTSKELQRRRLLNAFAGVAELRSILKFDRITLVIKTLRRWQFRYAAIVLLEYWPARAQASICGKPSIRCVSIAQARRLALKAKRKLFANIASIMQRTPN